MMIIKSFYLNNIEGLWSYHRFLIKVRGLVCKTFSACDSIPEVVGNLGIPFEPVSGRFLTIGT